MPRVSRLLIAALAVLLTGCAIPQPRTATKTSEPTLAAGERLSDQDLQARWWTWALASPEERNPVADETGKFCAEDQPKDVWFLAGTFGGAVDRTCRVPAGRPLAAPAVNRYSANTAHCREFMTGVKGTVTLDGQPVELRRIDPVEITFQVARDNAIGERGGKQAAQACGLWAWIPPLTPGEHDLLIEGEAGSFSTSAHYKLTITGGD